MTYYETWSGFPECYLESITVTDAPPGIQVVPAEDYDRLKDWIRLNIQEPALDELVKEAQERGEYE